MTLMVPTPVRSGSTFLRRCCALRWLRGENRAVAVGLLLQLLLQSLPHPFATLGFNFQFHLSQCAFALWWFGHDYGPRAWVLVFSSDEEPDIAAQYSRLVVPSRC